MTIWDMVSPEFTKAGRWGDPGGIDGFLLVALLIVRRETGWPIVIHNALESDGHRKTGQHPKGKAADFHFVTKAPFREQVIKVLSILENYQLANSVGLGLYPYWNTKGFHLDSRGSRARWSYNQLGEMVTFDEGIT